MVLGNLRKFQGVPEVVHVVSGTLQRDLTGDFRGIHGFNHVPRGFRDVLEFYSSFRSFPEVFKKYQ